MANPTKCQPTPKMPSHCRGEARSTPAIKSGALLVSREISSSRRVVFLTLRAATNQIVAQMSQQTGMKSANGACAVSVSAMEPWSILLCCSI